MTLHCSTSGLCGGGREFILLSILPVLVATLSGRRGSLTGWQQRLQRLDRALVHAVPAAGIAGSRSSCSSAERVPA